MNSTPEQLWSDERIVAEAEAIGAYFDSQEVGIETRKLCIQIRDNYQAREVALLARIAELEQQLADLRNSGCYPTPDTSGGSLTIGGPIIAEWCTTEENEAWAHLQGDDNEAAN